MIALRNEGITFGPAKAVIANVCGGGACKPCGAVGVEVCALRRARSRQRRVVGVGGVVVPRDELCSILVVRRHRRGFFRRLRERIANAPRAASGGAGGCAGGRRGGSIGSAAASPAPKQSLDLASHVELELFVACLLQTFEGCGVLLIADAGNPNVGGPVVRGDGQEGCEVGNELPREGPGLWHLWSSCRCWNQVVGTLDCPSEKVRVVTGELEGSKALAGVKILQELQEELVEKSVLLRGEKEGLVRIIFGLEAVLCVVLLEVELAACNLGKKMRKSGSRHHDSTK